MATPATVRVYPLDFPETIGTNGQVIQTDGSGASAWTTPTIITDYPLGYINEMGITHVSANQKRIEIGQARSQDNVKNIDVTVPLTLTLSNSGVNGLDTGVEAVSTWYYIYTIVDDSDVLPVAGIFSISSTSPTLPVGYDRFRFIGAAKNSSVSDFLVDYMINTDGVDRVVQFDEAPFTTAVYIGVGITSWSSLDVSHFMPVHATQVVVYSTAEGSGTVSNFTEYRATGLTLTSTPHRVYYGDRQSNGIFRMGIESSRFIEHQSNVVLSIMLVSILGYSVYVGV